MRINAWEQALQDEVLRFTQVWQKGNALLFVANCVYRMTGMCPLEAMPVEAGSSRLKIAKVMDLQGLARARCWQEVQPAFAQRGDVVLVEGLPGVVALDGRRVWLVRRGKKRPTVSELNKATKAWRID